MVAAAGCSAAPSSGNDDLARLQPPLKMLRPNYHQSSSSKDRLTVATLTGAQQQQQQQQQQLQSQQGGVTDPEVDSFVVDIASDAGFVNVTTTSSATQQQMTSGVTPSAASSSLTSFLNELSTAAPAPLTVAGPTPSTTYIVTSATTSTSATDSFASDPVKIHLGEDADEDSSAAVVDAAVETTVEAFQQQDVSAVDADVFSQGIFSPNWYWYYLLL